MTIKGGASIGGGLTVYVDIGRRHPLLPRLLSLRHN